MTAIPTPIRSDPKELTPEPKTPPVEILKEGLFQPTEIYNALPTPPETPEKSRKAFSTSAGPSTLSLGRPKPETPKSVLFQPRTLDSDKLKPEIFNSALFQPIDTTDLPNTRDSSSQDHEERIPQSFLLSTLLRILRKAPAYIVATTYNKAQVTKLVHFIRELREGNPKNSEWSAWKLNRSGYEQLLDRVNNDAELCGYFYDKLRYEYSPTAGIFTIRMPDNFHQKLSKDVAENILKKRTQLQLKPDNPIGRIIEKLETGGPRKVLHDDGSHTITDESILYDWCDSQGDEIYRMPLVVEVSWSGDPKDVEKKALEVLQERHTTDQIRTLVHFDANKLYKVYKAKGNKGKAKVEERDESVRFSVQRVVFDNDQEEITTDKLVYQTFRDKNSQTVADVSLDINLQDLISRDDETHLPNTKFSLESLIISISAEELNQMVENALKHQRVYDTNLKKVQETLSRESAEKKGQEKRSRKRVRKSAKKVNEGKKLEDEV